MRMVAKQFVKVLWLACWMVVTAGCTIQLISSYDEQTDKSVTALQKKTESFFVKLGGLDGLPDCTYDKQKSFYDDAKVDISGIKVRADAIPQNAITSEQVKILAESLSKLEELHKAKATKPPGRNCLSAEEIQPLQENFNISYTAILKLELAKKRGSSK